MPRTDKLLTFLGRASRRGDIVIAVLLLTAIIMMLIPLPTFLVDGLITANIALSVLILLASFYVTHPLQFSSMPSVILIATLFRLAISITTTRLILLNADAGEIIATFGKFVVGGSIGVGLVIFFIITIAQFIVVAKGSERVAEVAARFTLDALPGKQMSIDAELRNGDIDQAEARHLRHQLERESQLYGAMDGAMKFVKGDVIAGIIIILVNLIGGFSVGMLSHGMSLGEAASVYTLLTVGDGLVAQIPALLVAVAAGTMVTRVGTSDGDGDLGRQITAQLLRDSRALALAAVIMIGLSLVPGFPMIAFFGLGLGLAAGAWVMHRNGAQEAVQASGSAAIGAIRDLDEQTPGSNLAIPADEQASLEALQDSHRVVVHLGSGLAGHIDEATFNALAGRVRHTIGSDLGIDIPAFGRFVDPDLAPHRLRVDLEGAPILDVEIPAGKSLALVDTADLELLEIGYEQGMRFPGERRVIWVGNEEADALQDAGLPVLDERHTYARWLEKSIRLYAGHFVGVQETRHLLAGMEKDYADLVNEAQSILSLQKIAEVLRRLVAEAVPIRNLRLILEALVESGQREKDVILLTEHARIALKRQISFRAADRNNIIAAYVLQRHAEDALRSASSATPTGAFLNMSDDRVQAIAAEIERVYQRAPVDAAPVVLSAMDVRRHLRSLLSHSGNELLVLSYQELASEFNVQPLATISGRARGAQLRETKTLPPAGTNLQGQAAP